MAKELHSYVARSFLLPKDLKLDPALRAAADSMTSAHLTRMSELLPNWVQEERAALRTGATEKTKSTELFYAVWARLLNELALWHLEPGDAAYEKATLEVLKTSPRVCQTEGDPRFQDFSGRMMRVQAMPAAQQQTAMAAERQLLARWGQPRLSVQPWPNPLPQDAAMLALEQIRAGGPRPPLALPPIFASAILAKRGSYKDLHKDEQCGLQQWWLRVGLARGTPPAAVLAAFRYGTLITVTERLDGVFESKDQEALKDQAPTIPAYPSLAARFGATGVTTITRRFDASGKPEHASVTGRKIAVPGIRGTRPVAFENIFDEMALHYALKGADSVKAGKTAPAVLSLDWNLESSPPPAP